MNEHFESAYGLIIEPFVFALGRSWRTDFPFAEPLINILASDISSLLVSVTEGEIDAALFQCMAEFSATRWRQAMLSYRPGQQSFEVLVDGSLTVLNRAIWHDLGFPLLPQRSTAREG